MGQNVTKADAEPIVCYVIMRMAAARKGDLRFLFTTLPQATCRASCAVIPTYQTRLKRYTAVHLLRFAEALSSFRLSGVNSLTVSEGVKV